MLLVRKMEYKCKMDEKYLGKEIESLPNIILFTNWNAHCTDSVHARSWLSVCIYSILFFKPMYLHHFYVGVHSLNEYAN